jgi:MinD superfamily P-loop ATPase
MKIAVVNTKGGVGKTTLGHRLIKPHPDAKRSKLD